ncbi:methyltransferase [Streptomyces clavuligerus]|uniref:O-methyltransferase family protein n=1 Tax=Streptomyces clavuligerus TaxID=1901 RepID=E2Q8B6_STRCL|nr:methyltransferase [Streptomyces clavuligerus]ANW21405.1 methyltransferase [Streptomyces clavuligerus]AXU16037.1 methyltransferase [Streptomyces clavuligerus]EFG05448.1 O-methyltransferase family protein [Streptomyces clavuligerus]MBY6306172.1 methyltransferase [Streptomyces clavuligerus]QCS08815.1 methyltransferase [Streptomyces clavuligerus]
MDEQVTPLPLMELTLGIPAFKALALATELELFTELAGGRSTTAAALAERHGLQPRPAELLLTACTSLGLLRLDADGAYRNTAMSEEFLVKGAPYYFGGWITLVDRHVYSAYTRLADSLRGNHPASWDPERQESLFSPDDPVVTEHFWEGMHSLSAYTGRLLADTLDFGAVGRLLDVGGGGAGFDIELCRRWPKLRATVFDLGFVCDLTRPRVAAAGLADRISFAAGDFFADPLPTGHDAVLLANILHDWDEHDARRILAACAEALPPGGLLLICESFVADDRTGPPPAALMSLNMLVEAWGRNYTAAEYSTWLRAAGLEPEGVTPFEGPGANGVLVARKP